MKRVLVLLLAVGLTAAACGGHKSSAGYFLIRLNV